MKKINFPALLLALLVVLMFCLVGVAIFYTSIFFIILFFMLGSAIMGLGITMKKKQMI